MNTINNKREFDTTIELKDNAMLKVRPHLFNEWDFEKNEELSLDVYKVTKGSVKRVWWICPKCKSAYDATINKRTCNRNCPYCRGLRVNHTNSLATLNPPLASQWHPTKNGNLTPNNVTISSREKIWWICHLCNSSWRTSLNTRSTGIGCPYCASKEVNHTNSLASIRPEIASEWHPTKNCDLTPHNVSFGSKQKVWWLCRCGHEWEAVINNRTSNISGCSFCSDGISYPEKIMFNVLSQINVKFETQKVFYWSDRKRYDFYIPDLNCIIETHGMQHYKHTGRGRSLEEEQVNDEYKYELAIINGVKPKRYITIDCRESDIDFIKNKIIHSKLAEIFDLSDVDWINVNKESTKSLIIEVCNSYKNENLSITDLLKKFGLSRSTIIKYLKRGSSIGLIKYESMKSIV